MAKKLIEIIGESVDVQIIGNAQKSIHNLCIDSRDVEKGDVFIAIVGQSVDGHNYIDKAIENGAEVIVAERKPSHIDKEITYLICKDTRDVLARMSDAFYEKPSKSVKLVGVTGTNGKTTVTTLLWQLFSDLGYKSGLISTVENRIGDKIVSATHTTPDNIGLNALLRKMVDAGCEYVFMEVSSHGIDQKRIQGLRFDIGVFTNVSHDHLDYHHTFKDYIWTKKKFFDQLHKDSLSIVNIDDKRGEVMVQNTSSELKSYALKRMADYKGKIIANDISGLTMQINDSEVHFKLVGEFNAYNLLSVYAVAYESGLLEEDILKSLSGLSGAEGRFEVVMEKGCDIVGIVDYAHTPDALENVLKTIQNTKHKDAQVYCVVGCGGDRDKRKRPLMAQIGSRLSDHLILTSDNPRNENPESIINEMAEGIKENEAIKIIDRAQAIEKATELADDGDIILIAGKGHEKYQEKKGVKTPFDDKKILRASLLKRI